MKNFKIVTPRCPAKFLNFLWGCLYFEIFLGEGGFQWCFTNFYTFCNNISVIDWRFKEWLLFTLKRVINDSVFSQVKASR